MKSIRKLQEGVTLPVVIVLSLTIMAIMVVLLTVASASYKGLYVDHYQKMADEAGEAGTAYATACLSLSSHQATWGPKKSKPNLAPNTDCAGANNYASNLYVYSDSTVRTTFSVGDLDYEDPSKFAAQISSTGTAQVLKSDGTVSRTYTSIKKKVITWPTDTGASMSASGTNRTCAIVSYSVYCWGYNRVGQLGNGQYVGAGSNVEDPAPTVDSIIPVKVYKAPGVMANKKIVKIFVAQYHSCALSSDGLMYCWGFNSQGQLGTGNVTDSAVPVQVAGALAGKTITDIGGTENMSCAIAAGKIYCWGKNSNGLVGINSTSPAVVNTPTLVSAPGGANNLAANYVATLLGTSGSRGATFCAVADAKAYCWGANEAGAIGDNTKVAKSLPTKVDTTLLGGKTITSISQDGYPSATGYVHTCAVASGAVYCWGENIAGEVGDSTTTDRTVPVAVTASGVLSGKTVQDVKVGLLHSCVRADNTVYCWGSNNPGQLGDGNGGAGVQKTAPVAVTLSAGGITSSNVVSIGAGANRSCAVITDGRTFCWGLNSNGQIGDGTTINRSSPTESLFLRPVSNQFIF